MLEVFEVFLCLVLMWAWSSVVAWVKLDMVFFACGCFWCMNEDLGMVWFWMVYLDYGNFWAGFYWL